MYLKQSQSSPRVPATGQGWGWGVFGLQKDQWVNCSTARGGTRLLGAGLVAGPWEEKSDSPWPLGPQAPHTPPGVPAAPSCGLQARSHLLTLGPRHGALRPSPCLLLPTSSEGLELRSYCLRLRGSRGHALFSHALRSPACLCTQPYFFQCLSLPKRL